MSSPEYQHLRNVKLQLTAIKKTLGMTGESVQYRDEVERVIGVLGQILEELGLSGYIKPYGSCIYGMSPNSDLDITALIDLACASPQDILCWFYPMVKKHFDNVVFIRNAKVPLLKLKDRQTGLEIDFCIGNHLSIYKSELLLCYCRCDERMSELVTNVKVWAEARELKGLHFFNSYTYMLMLVHCLQSCDPPVLPNLQAASVATTPWVSQNTDSTDGLLLGFFEYFCRFKWAENAVCPRLNQAGAPIKKLSLDKGVKASQWYIEDPLEPRSFNNAKCTAWGQGQILDEMQETTRNLREGKPWQKAYVPSSCFLQCSLSAPRGTTVKKSPALGIKALEEFGSTRGSKDMLHKEFEEFGITDITSPRHDGGRDPSVHLHFPDQASLQRALTKTGVYLEECEVKLYTISSRLRGRTPCACALCRPVHPVPHTCAQHNLAVCYQKGEGVQQDLPEAVKFYKLAAHQGDALAQ